MAFSPFDIFTGSSVSDAADQTRQFLMNQQALQQQQIAAAKQQGLDALTSGATSAIGAITPAIAQARTDISSGIAPTLSALYGGQDLATGALTGSVDPALAALYGGAGGAAAAYDPLKSLSGNYAQFGLGAGGSLSDALGLNGPEGVARAQSQFQTGPGFQFQLGTGLDALTRAANAAGMVASGNTLRNAQQFGSGLAAQEWQNYLKNLQTQAGTYSPLALQGLSTAATGLGNIGLTTGQLGAGIFSNLGTNLANQYQTTAGRAASVFPAAATSLADLEKTGGLASADVYQNEAARQAALIQGLTSTGVGAETALASPIAQSIMAPGLAEMQGSQNLWGGLLGGLKLAAGGGWLPSLSPTGAIGFGQKYGT